jgi:hypothetical protein
MQGPSPVWRAILMIVLVIMAGCHAIRPDSVTRIQENCAAGDQWACDLLHGPGPVENITTPTSVRDDVDAIMKGIDRAITSPHTGSPDSSPNAGEHPIPRPA